jgi:methylenetetrahydrofolate reductase (NADPH)
MKITDLLLKNSQPIFSFEFFPPKTEDGIIELFEILREVRALNPGFISVTYGAGGATKDKTIEIVKRAKKEIGLESMAHLTCVGHSRSEIASILDELVSSDIENIAALRGDPPKGETSFAPRPDGFMHASDLTAFIRARSSLCIAVAGYPEGHIEAPDKETDWNYLHQKIIAGANLVITQLFFDNRDFFAFERRMREKGATVPIVPGIMPITNYHQIIRFTQTCGATIPQKVARNIEKMKSDLKALQQYGVEYATQQCADLIAHGVPGIHFYTLNKSDSTRKIVENLRE